MEVISECYESVYAWFWADRFWLPGNTTWSELTSTDTVRYPNAGADVWTTIPVACILLLLRAVFEKYIASPIGRYYGLNYKPHKSPPPHAHLESCYRVRPKPSSDEIRTVARHVGWRVSRVNWWYRLRRNQNRPAPLKKFNESCWKFVYYISAFIYGLIVLYDKPWFYDTNHCWRNYPFHHISPEIYWYYTIEAGFYVSLTMSHSFDTKRKDFTQMFIHHITTLLLLYFSWVCNMVRVGTLVLVLHDAADWLMEGAKMALYCKLQRVCDALFVIFTITWFITRLVLYPLRVIYPGMTTAHRMLNMPILSCYYIYNSLLCVLQLMHVIWFYMIVRIAYNALRNGGQVQKDDRSSSEESEGEHDSNSNGSVSNGEAITECAAGDGVLKPTAGCVDGVLKPTTGCATADGTVLLRNGKAKNGSVPHGTEMGDHD